MTRLDKLVEREEAAIYRDLEDGLFTQAHSQRLAALCRLSPAPNQSAKDVSMIGFFITCGVLFAIIAACWNA